MFLPNLLGPQRSEALLAWVRRGGRLVIAEPNEQPLSLMRRSGFVDEIGERSVFDELDAALTAVSADQGS